MANPSVEQARDPITRHIWGIKLDKLPYLSLKLMATPTPLPVQRAARDIGQHLVAWRKLRGLTIKQVADRAGVSDKTVSRLATDPGSVSLENLLRIARALGILDSLVTAADPLSTDIGRLRASEQLPQRVRHPNAREDA
jgi:DNA-binding Xre family transcriptional regulator